MTAAEGHRRAAEQMHDVNGAAVESTQHIGGLDVFDLQLLNQLNGGDPLPYPFMLTRPTRFEFADQVEHYAHQLSERVRTGDLSQFARCLDALRHADVTVTAVVQHIPADTPTTRVLALRAGQAGYLMQQRVDEDVLDVSLVSPFELGPTVAAAMALKEPGRHSTVYNGELAPVTAAVDDDDDALVVRHEVQTTPGVTVFAEQVSVYAKVQSTWLPAQEWGIDETKECLVWVRLTDDGDYLGAPDRSHGTPITTAALGQRINDLVDSDLEALREYRGE